ncbi:30S ribosomal protein S6 [Helicobacter apodemus]|uniref:Small ribosomal subunit protein bS6 n=1 Tax=Helicobacter apodemus TaxID=135569 RepID=A0A4U8UGP1_9HELI|nr:30S ribosomal protein S6 [Helicobacter apodemus]TLE15582.1 30S ribosomal protein S6 [Helicobacter apodemus]
MRFYETMFVVKPTLTQEEITTKIDFYKTAIVNNGGEISATLDMGMRNLAYEIKKNKRGYYFVIYFKAEPKLVLELERLYRINEDILRFIVIKYDSKKEQKAWEVLVDRAIHNKKPIALKESKDKEPREEKIEDDKEQSPTIEV